MRFSFVRVSRAFTEPDFLEFSAGRGEILLPICIFGHLRHRKLNKATIKTKKMSAKASKINVALVQEQTKRDVIFIIIFSPVPVNLKVVGDGKILRNKIQIILPRRKSEHLLPNDGGALMHTFVKAASRGRGKYNSTKEEVK